jgi:L-lactate dehydrogenase (cytochrome)
MMRLARVCNIDDLRKRALSVLPDPMLHYLEGGADDEQTLRRNREAFAAFDLIPHFLVDVANVDTTTEVLGQKLPIPLMLAPTGMSRLFHPQAELAVARAAAEHGTMFCLSTVGSETIESVAAVSNGPKMFQIYVLGDHGLNTEFISRARESGYDALCLTIDVPVGGNRERDVRTGMAIPPKFTWRSNLSFVTRPRWSLRQLFGPRFDLPIVSGHVPDKNASLAERMAYIFRQFDPSVTWKDAERMIAEWNGPFAVKGVLSPDDARQAIDIGATAVMVSNHGGRQLDTSPATIDALAEIVAAVDGQAEVIVDGGIRRGTDVIKALALGAKACMIGRPYLYGLTVAGQAGVSKALDIFTAEIYRDMALLGCRNVNEIGPRHIRRRPVSG